MPKEKKPLEEVLGELLKDGFDIKITRELNMNMIEVSKWTLGKKSAYIPDDHMYKIDDFIEYCKDQLTRGNKDSEDES